MPGLMVRNLITLVFDKQGVRSWFLHNVFETRDPRCHPTNGTTRFFLVQLWKTTAQDDVLGVVVGHAA
jgi:hypothetical protein